MTKSGNSVMTSLKRRPVTIGLLISLVVAVVFVISTGLRVLSVVEGAAESAVERHQRDQLQLAHPEAKKRLERIEHKVDRLLLFHVPKRTGGKQ